MKNNGLIEIGVIVVVLLIIVSVRGIFSTAIPGDTTEQWIDYCQFSNDGNNYQANGCQSGSNAGLRNNFVAFYIDDPSSPLDYYDWEDRSSIHYHDKWKRDYLEQTGQEDVSWSELFKRVSENEGTKCTGTLYLSWDRIGPVRIDGDVVIEPGSKRTYCVFDSDEVSNEYTFIDDPSTISFTLNTDFDKDNDDVMDWNDNCPDEAGEGEFGCPLTDSDQDGTYDRNDECPNTFGTKENGCPTFMDKINNLFIIIRNYINSF